MDKNTKNWLWEHEDYPNYTYDKESLRPSLEKIDELVSAVNTAFAGLDERTQREILALSACDELISSFKIEGISLKEKSLLKNLRAELSDDGNSENSAYSRFAHLALNSRFDRDLPDERRILSWHSLLFSRGAYEFGRVAVGAFRTEPVYVGSYKKYEFIVDYEAPPAKDCPKLVSDLLDFLATSDENEFIKAGLAHFAFVLIHPFDDGNGRSTRLLADFYANKNCKLISHSPMIYMRRREYYAMLKECQRLDKPNSMDITEWIAWHLEISTDALEIALANLREF